MSLKFDSDLSDNNGVTPLMLAVENNDFDIEFLKHVIRKCMNPARVDSMNRSVLHHCLIGDLSEYKQIETVRYLISHAKNVALISSDVLHFAVAQTVCPAKVTIELLHSKGDDYSKDVKAITTAVLASNRSTQCKINCLKKLLPEFDMRIIDLFKGKYLTVPQKRKIVSNLVQYDEISDYPSLIFGN